MTSFNRTRELAILQSRAEEGNHILLSGQRRMGKSSLARQLGLQLETQGWKFLFVDIEDALTAEDVIAEIAEEAYKLKGLLTRFLDGLRNYLPEVDELSAYDFKIKVRASIDAGSWPERGKKLFANFAESSTPILLVIDELPIFLNRLLKKQNGYQLVDKFMSWLRSQLQSYQQGELVVLVSGSIGLEPMMRRLGLSDRINHLEPPFRLGPWDENTSTQCLKALASNYGLTWDEGVSANIYQRLGVGFLTMCNPFLLAYEKMP